MKKFAILLVSLTMAMSLAACGSSEESSEENKEESADVVTEETHIYDNATVETIESDVPGSDVSWTYSVAEAPSDEITEDTLLDWYNNYIVPTDYQWYIIQYTDNPDMGVYEQDDILYKDVYLKRADSGVLTSNLDDSDLQETMYIIEDGKLTVYAEPGED